MKQVYEDRYLWLGRLLLCLIAAMFALLSVAAVFADVPDFKVRSVKAIVNPPLPEQPKPAEQPKAVEQPASKPVQATSKLHSHLCPKCGHEWWHGDEHFGRAASHACPKCGTMQWVVHRKAADVAPATVAPIAKPLELPVFQSGGGCPVGVCPTARGRRGR
ncbi:MAG: hypothetical protein E6Q40_08845 [Cupriavidus sp.]|nr:MAG: hypothetical protein E6Q40_08845 [Cupriavidus sp.]